MTAAFPFNNSYAQLPERFFARVPPRAVAAPRLIALNRPLAHQLGLDADWLSSTEGVEAIAGNRVLDGADPIAMAYAGHQFGQFTSQLGDGRAVLLGEVIDRAGQRRDIHLKGSGPTPFSRRGDGRAALGPVLREYIVSEAMAALGIPTTRALMAMSTGERVIREAFLPGAILVRVASSHVRVGTFQFFAARGDHDATRILADYVIARCYPDVQSRERPYLALLEAIALRQADLVARWMLVGFVHGVMNTDNMSVTGETIDYGPCAFLDDYDPAKVFSSIDTLGRYAYGNQPRLAQWNIARLAEALLPLLDENEGRAVADAEQVLGAFPQAYEAAFLHGLRRKLGLFTEDRKDASMARDLLDAMAAHHADFTLTFRHLCDAAVDPQADETVRALFNDPNAFDIWAHRWRARLERERVDPALRAASMRSSNPAYIPRNHRIEAAIQAAVQESDLTLFDELITAIAQPYENQPAFKHLAAPPQPSEQVWQTFCGT